MTKRLLLFLLFVIPSIVASQTPQEYSIAIRATPEGDALRLMWSRSEDATVTFLYRRTDPANNWGTETLLDADDTTYVDNTVETGRVYEYKITRLEAEGHTAYGFIMAGVDVPTPTSEGNLLLVVDNEHASSLAFEIERLKLDMSKDGWRVQQLNVDRTLPPSELKEKIQLTNENTPGGLRSLFLFGRIPVAYSGNFSPDEHEDHIGAWPADVFYADLDGDWTDITVEQTKAEREQNKNIRGDGKFDQSELPSDVELEVGRVDMRNLPQFDWQKGLKEIDLLRRYLDKNHAYRSGKLEVTNESFVSDDLGKLANDDIPASIAWRTFPLFSNEIDTGNWMDSLSAKSYLWAYGAGFGTWYALSSVGTTEDYAKRDPKAVFTMMIGSRFGDWDTEDNLLRAPLGTSTGLASVFGGRPYWYFHPMAAGKTIGYSTKLSQNNTSYVKTVFMRGVHMALMGDPTLKLPTRVPAVPSLAIVKQGEGYHVSWGPVQSATGYLVYRAPSVGGAYALLTPSPLTSLEYIDNESDGEESVYMVRAIARVTNYAGSQLVISQGTMRGAKASVKTQDPYSSLIRVEDKRVFLLSSEVSKVMVYDILGKEVRAFVPPFTSMSLEDLRSGSYFVTAISRTGADVIRYQRM